MESNACGANPENLCRKMGAYHKRERKTKEILLTTIIERVCTTTTRDYRERRLWLGLVYDKKVSRSGGGEEGLVGPSYTCLSVVTSINSKRKPSPTWEREWEQTERI